MSLSIFSPQRGEGGLRVVAQATTLRSRPGGAKEISGATKGRLCQAITPRLRVVAQATTLRS